VVQRFFIFCYQLKNTSILSAGLFQDRNFNLTQQIFIYEKPAYYEFSNQTENLTGQQVFEKYAPTS